MALLNWWSKIYLEEKMDKTIKGKTIVYLLILTNSVYAYMLLVSIPKVIGFSGGMKIPDMMPTGYEPEYMLNLLEKLGEQGRDVYLYQQIPVDLCYPFLFGITYCLLTGYLLNKLHKLKAESFYLCILPLLAGFFDYLENAGLIYILSSYPHVTDLAIHITAFFTVIKSLLSTLGFIIIIVLLLAVVYQKLLKNKRKAVGINGE